MCSWCLKAGRTGNGYWAVGSMLCRVRECAVNEIPSGGARVDGFSSNDSKICSRDYHGVAWAQYDLGFRKQMVTLKDLRWSCKVEHYVV